jgi:hypothetical protein
MIFDPLDLIGKRAGLWMILSVAMLAWTFWITRARTDTPDQLSP